MKLSQMDELILVWGVISKAALSEIKATGNTVLVPENRPFLLGLKRNVPLLKENNIPFIYCADNVLGFLFYKNKIAKTLIFYKEKTSEQIKGICGSLYACLLSKLHGVPIEIYRQGDINSEFLDKNAATLERKDFILEEDKEKYIIEASDEIVPKEVLN